MRIDAHQHFWKYDPQRDSWITDDMTSIKRNFLPEDLLPIIEKNNIQGTVAVQASQSLEETQFLLDLAGKNPWIKGVVGWVDLQSEKVAEELELYSDNPVFKGVRHIVQSENEGFLLSPNFLAGIKALEKTSLTYDILIYSHQIKKATQMVKLFPNQKFIVDHLAKPDIKSGSINEWKTDISKLAELDNVYCKISGMVTEAYWSNWTLDEFRPYLEQVENAFGVERLVFGSDYPVCLLAAEYDEVLDIIEDYLDDFSISEQDAVFGGNAISFYNL